MALKVGIIGLPNVGKSTLFNALTRTRSAPASNFPFCTIDPNVGIVEVPDERLTKLNELLSPPKVTPATVEFLDVAGLVKGAHKGEGLGNQFLGAIREVHALCHVVRFFEDTNIAHVDGEVNPKRDRETIETELQLADLETTQKRIEKMGNAAKTGNKEKQLELAALEKFETALKEGKSASSVSLNKEEAELLTDLHLLTAKPIIYAANVSEEQLNTLNVKHAKEQLGSDEESEVIIVCAEVEEGLQDLTEEEAKEYLNELHITSSGLDNLIREAYKALGYITFFTTTGGKELRAWTALEETTAPDAAGIIHTDFKKGFIKADTINCEEFIELGSEHNAREAGKIRSEGKNYIVQDGDVIHFKFNT